MNDDKSQKELRNIPIIAMVIFIASLGIGITMFNQHVENEVKKLFSSSRDISNAAFLSNPIINLLEHVKRYFEYSLQEGQIYVSFVNLKHEGMFKQSEGQGWIPIVGKSTLQQKTLNLYG